MSPLLELVERCAAYGGGTSETWRIPQTASIQLREGAGHLLEGAVISEWIDNR